MSDVGLSIVPSCRDCGKTPRVTGLIDVMIALEPDHLGIPVYLCVEHWLKSKSERDFERLAVPKIVEFEQPSLNVPTVETRAERR